MNVDQLLQTLSERNVRVWVEGKLLRFRAHENELDESLIATLRQHKSELIQKLRRQESPRYGASQLEPLSVGQQALYFLHALAPDSPAYNCASAARIRSPVDVDSMRQAFQRLISRHDSFRTTFGMREGRSCRIVHASGDLDLRQISATDWSEACLHQAVVEEYERPFDLEMGPLLRVRLFSVSEADHVFLMAMHHIVFDAWSLWLMQDEFRSLYQQYTGGQTALLPALEASYSDFARQQEALQSNEQGDRLWQYWRDRLSGELIPPELPLDHPRPEHGRQRGATHRFRVPRELTARLRDLAKSCGATPFMLMLSIFKVLVHRYTGLGDMIVGTTTSGRSRTEFTRVIGYFVNTLAIRTEMSGDQFFRDFLAQVKSRTLEAIENQEFPFPLLVDRLNPSRESGRLPICSVMFGMQKPQQFSEVTRLFDEETGHIDWGGLEVHPYELDQQEGQFDLTLELFDTNDSFLGTLKYDVDLFTAETAERIGDHYVRLAEEIVEDPDRRLADIEIMTDDERDRVVRFSSTGHAIPAEDPRIHRLFESQVAQTPDAVAAVGNNQTLTYDELNRRANQVARMLRAHGVKLGSLVACRLERSLDVPVVVLAVLKAGAVYVPLDSASPGERVNQIVRDSGADLIIVHSATSFQADEAESRVIVFDECRRSLSDLDDSNLDLELPVGALAYTLYTSGSTGQPKGVSVSHRAFADHVISIRGVFELTAGDRVLQFSNLTFDPSLEQMFAPWSVGATVVFRGNELSMPHDFWQEVCDHRLTVINVPPAYLSRCNDAIPADFDETSSLRLLIVGGDIFSVESLKVWQGRNVRILNAYGPTEAVVTATVFDATHHDTTASRVPIGRPKPGLSAYVLDDHGRLVPIGVAGELHLGGSMLAEGYLNDTELTSSRFVADPCREAGSSKMYRTGDRVRWTPNGNLEFLGRVDRQVKINGFRVETGEIESVLTTYQSVSESFVQVRNDYQGDPHLVAWLVAARDQDIDQSQLRSCLRRRLPSYMVPRHFVVLEQFPLKASGKVDANALPEPVDARPADCEYAPPRNDTERLLAHIWAQVLNVETVGIDDNFFDLGGGSLTSLRIVAQAGEAGLKPNGVILKPELLFEYPTVSELAAFLKSEVNSKP